MAVVVPGISVTSRTSPPPRGSRTNTGTWFVVGTAERGSLAAPHAIRNMEEFRRYYGARTPSSILSDSLETYFREGGVSAYVQRVAGPNAVAATRTFNDSSTAPSLKIDAKNPGAWGNNLTVGVSTSEVSGEYYITVFLSGVQVDRSPSLADQGAAINWASNPEGWVTISLPVSAGGLDPAVISPAALSGGADDYAGVNDTIRIAGLALFDEDLGPGQVSVPGNTTTAVRAALLAHGRANNRQALLDSTDSGVASTLASEAQSLQGDEYGALFGPWVKIPGLTLGTTRTVPPVSLAAGLIARSDGTQSPNDPAAGENGIARFVTAVTQTAFSGSDRTAINAAGLTLIRTRPIAGTDVINLYGLRTLAKPTDETWLQIGNQRLRMAITDKAKAIAEQFLFKPIDGKGTTIAAFGGALSGMLLGYFNDGSLYGDNSSDAFIVDVGDTVNTPTTIAARELHAIISLRMSPSAELVAIEIVKTPVSQSL